MKLQLWRIRLHLQIFLLEQFSFFWKIIVYENCAEAEDFVNIFLMGYFGCPHNDLVIMNL